MATRALIKVYYGSPGSRTSVNIYKHTDGYPKNLGVWLGRYLAGNAPKNNGDSLGVYLVASLANDFDKETLLLVADDFEDYAWLYEIYPHGEFTVRVSGTDLLHHTGVRSVELHWDRLEEWAGEV